MSAELPQNTRRWLAENGVPASQVRFPAAAFSDGVLVAELLHRKFPLLLDLHSYPKSLNSLQKLENWEALRSRPLRKLGLSLSKAVVESLASRRGSTAVLSNFLQKLQQRIDAFVAKYEEIEKDALHQAKRDTNRFRSGTKALRKRLEQAKLRDEKLFNTGQRPRTSGYPRKHREMRDTKTAASLTKAREATNFSCEQIDNMYVALVDQLRQQHRTQIARNAELEAYCEVVDAEISCCQDAINRNNDL